MSDIKRLIDVSAPATVDASYESLRSNRFENQPFTHAQRWKSLGQTFLLNASVSMWGKRWVGFYDLARCEEAEVLEEWALDDGSMLDVISIRVAEHADAERWIHLSYLSNCVLVDDDCLESEEQRLWPRLRGVAEREKANVVSIVAEDCRPAGEEITYEKISGDWVRLRP